MHDVTTHKEHKKNINNGAYSLTLRGIQLMTSKRPNANFIFFFFYGSSQTKNYWTFGLLSYGPVKFVLSPNTIFFLKKKNHLKYKS